MIGPLLAFALLRWAGLDLRHALPADRDSGSPGGRRAGLRGPGGTPRDRSASQEGSTPDAPLGGRFWAYLGVLFLFTLGQLDGRLPPAAGAPARGRAGADPDPLGHAARGQGALQHSGGILSDRLGRKPLLIAGWLLYAAVYFAFGRAGAEWQVWALFAVYGIYFGLTEGVEKALVADLVPADRRGAAFGWYNLALGFGALPASLLFGAIWDRWGATAAFTFGAAMALAAAVGIALVQRPSLQAGDSPSL